MQAHHAWSAHTTEYWAPTGHKATWSSLEHLGALVRRHSADDTAAKAIRRIMRADVIVIDDIGLLPITTETAEALYRVVDAAYEKRSTGSSPPPTRGVAHGLATGATIRSCQPCAGVDACHGTVEPPRVR